MNLRARVLIPLLLAAAICPAASRPSRKRAAPAGESRSRVVKSWMRSLTLHEKAAQLVMVPFFGDAPNPRSEEYQKYLRAVRNLRVGGLVLVNRVQDVRARSASVASTFPTATTPVTPPSAAGDLERIESRQLLDP